MSDIFRKRLKKLRIDRDIDQKNLAKALSATQQKVSNWERGIIEPDMETLTKLALFFDVSTDYLLGIESEFQKPKKYRNSDEL